MKNFDEDRQEREQRDRQFQIGGETFVYRPSVSPEALLPYHRAITGEVSPTEEEWIGIYDQTVTALLEPGQDEVWTRARAADATNPLNAKDISDLLTWLLEQQTGPPYWAFVRIFAYWIRERDWIEGRTILAGGAGTGGLSLRQVCNLSYAVLIEGIGDKERKELDKELRAHPARPYSRGSGDLMAMMGGGRRS